MKKPTLLDADVMFEKLTEQYKRGFNDAIEAVSEQNSQKVEQRIDDATLGEILDCVAPGTLVSIDNGGLCGRVKTLNGRWLKELDADSFGFDIYSAEVVEISASENCIKMSVIFE